MPNRSYQGLFLQNWRINYLHFMSLFQCVQRERCLSILSWFQQYSNFKELRFSGARLDPLHSMNLFLLNLNYLSNTFFRFANHPVIIPGYTKQHAMAFKRRMQINENKIKRYFNIPKAYHCYENYHLIFKDRQLHFILSIYSMTIDIYH